MPPVSGLVRSWTPPALTGIECFRAQGVAHTYPRHSHEGYALGVIEEGVGGLFCRGATSFIPAGHVVVMNPGEAHTGFPAHTPLLTWRMFYIRESTFQDGDAPGARPLFDDLCSGDWEWAKRLRDLHCALEREGELMRQEIETIETFRMFSELFGRVAVVRCCGEESKAVRMAKEFLSAHYAENIRLSTLAQIVGLNSAYFIRSFRRATGIPPHAWLLQRRIMIAKQLIAGGVPLTEVALQTGFADQSHFTRRFKALVGTTPRQYRNGHLRSTKDDDGRTLTGDRA
jgi:AraC-like DNA-binding protein